MQNKQKFSLLVFLSLLILPLTASGSEGNGNFILNFPYLLCVYGVLYVVFFCLLSAWTNRGIWLSMLDAFLLISLFSLVIVAPFFYLGTGTSSDYAGNTSILFVVSGLLGAIITFVIREVAFRHDKK